MNKTFAFLVISLVLAIGEACAQTPTQSSPIFEKSISNLRNQRYCEVLLGKRTWLKLEVKVFNTQGLNLCPETQWNALTKESIEKTFDASLVVLNGPRYWMMDEIHAAGKTVNDVKESFGGIEMNLRATIQLGLLKQLSSSQKILKSPISSRLLVSKPVITQTCSSFWRVISTLPAWKLMVVVPIRDIYPWKKRLKHSTAIWLLGWKA